jgi:hypothetical protein
MMAIRLAARSVRREGPVPFSTEWIESPDPPQPRRRRVPVPSWLPGERIVSAILVLLLTASTALIATGTIARGDRSASSSTTGEVSQPPASALLAPTIPSTLTAPRTATLPLITSANTTPPVGGAADPSPTPGFAHAPNLGSPTAAHVTLPSTGDLLPTYRIVTFYGHPHDEHMGVLGEYSMKEIRDRVLAEAANYQAADPSRPVIPAFELISTVAQPTAGSDGTYILNTDLPTLTEYVDYAGANDMLVFLDLQIGRGTVASEIEKVRPLLERPNVHLALDPEFAIAEGEIPGDSIGSLDAASITYAQQTLATLAADNGLPPKILMVHQFREDMIVNKNQLAAVPGVQLVIDADGYGAPILKTDVYNILVRDEPVEFGGIKLFYKQDKPLMSAEEILALNPPPDVIVYQ